MMLKTPILALLAVSVSWAATVYVNQAGYNAELPKIAVVSGAASLAGSSFTLKSAGSVVHTGTLGQPVALTDWGSEPYFLADFSAFATPGTYTLEISNNGSPVASYSFKIEQNLYATQALPKIVDYFFKDRADRSDVWAKDAAISKYGDNSGKTYNVQGGWYDAAGDISKYLSHLSYGKYLNPQQTPMTVWAMAFVKERIPALLSSTGLSAKVQAEALWGADFLMRMLDPEGYFYLTVFDGWSGKMEDRKIAAFSGSGGDLSSKYQAAFREGGGMSIAALARVSAWGVNGDSSSAAYLAAAERAYAHLKINNLTYCDSSFENIIDDYTALLAASELYQTTKKPSYIEDARLRAASLVGRLAPDGYFFSDPNKNRPFWHASDAGLPLVALTRYLEVEPASQISTTIVAMQKHLDYLVGITNASANPFGYARQTFRSQGTIQTGFFIPHDNESGYWWQGENARLASLSTAAFYAGRMVYKDPSGTLNLPGVLLSYGTRQLDWILGSNPLRISFFHGLGTTNPVGYFNAAEKATQLVGGIANGITGVSTNGTGLQFKVNSDFGDAPWESWRWVEQWIPHSTWFLMAIASLYDETPLAPATINPPARRIAMQGAFSVKNEPNGVEIRVAKASAESKLVTVLDLHGRVVSQAMLLQGSNSAKVEMTTNRSGVYVVRLGKESKRIVR